MTDDKCTSTVFSREEMFESFASGTCDYMDWKDKLIRSKLIHQNLLLLFSTKGAVLGKDGDGFLFLKYWKRLNLLNRCSQVIVRKPVMYFSGFCPRNRGIHWKI